MALTRFGGPLSRKLPETRTFTVEGPAHSLLLEPFRRRVRALVTDPADGAEVVVLDTVRGALLHETGLGPQLYLPAEDVRADLLHPSDTSTHCPFKGDASYQNLTVGHRTIPDAVWSYPDPKPDASWLAGLVALPMSAADRWLDEDEDVLGHLTDPYHRVDLRPTGREVTVTAPDGTVVARTTSAVLLDETGLDVRFYLDRADVHATLRPSGTTRVCPYKGVSTYWTVEADGGDEVVDGAWSYEAPRDESRGIAGRICFSDDYAVSVASS
ncbi:MAG: hypothetical protein QOE59_901 [Actinomycetota bacterium]|jgi:uncharacterized protein (DUF427 family)|nr:hypothetical protein [Actinomycetota bacterium]